MKFFHDFRDNVQRAHDSIVQDVNEEHLESCRCAECMRWTSVETTPTISLYSSEELEEFSKNFENYTYKKEKEKEKKPEKTPMNLAPMEILEVFSKMCMVGINKGYKAHTWLTEVSIDTHLESLKRHIRDYEKGIDIDVDGFHNLEAILWRAASACLVHKFKTQPNHERWLANTLKKKDKEKDA